MVPGARTWSARSTTAIRPAASRRRCWPGCRPPPATRWIGSCTATATASGASAAVTQRPDRRRAATTCCAARAAWSRCWAPRARLLPVAHPGHRHDPLGRDPAVAPPRARGWRAADRAAELRPQDHAGARGRLRRGGRRAGLRAGPAAGAGRPLRAHAGGRRLLPRAAAAALALVGAGGTTWLDLPAPAARGPRLAAVRIGAATASAGEVLAALLVAHGGAALCGSSRAPARPRSRR